MPNKIFIGQDFYYLTDNVDSIRNLDAYQQIRDEVNRCFNPLSGGTDWNKIRQDCEILAKGPGVDLLICSYMVVANLKIMGLAGYANSLEILCLCLGRRQLPDNKTAKMHKDILDWMNTRVAKELRDIKPHWGALGDLYRCERYCDRIHQIIGLQQPKYHVDFEGVGFAIFEKIDQIETQYHVLEKRQKKTQSTASNRAKKRWLAGGFLSVTVILVFCIWTYFETPLLHRELYVNNHQVPILTDGYLAEEFLQTYSVSQLNRMKKDIFYLYEKSISNRLNQSVEQSLMLAVGEYEALQILYSDTEELAAIKQNFAEAQKNALEQTERFIERFSEIRTKMANISLLAQRERWSELQRQTKSLEDFAISLSPIYGRVDYVQTLISQGEIALARKEFDILRKRLNNLNWKMVELELRLRELTHHTVN